MPDLSTQMQAQAAAVVNRPFLLVYLDVLGDNLWAWTGQQNVTITVASDPLLVGGRTFLGVADIGSISDVTHAADGTVQALSLGMSHADFTDPATFDFVNYVEQWSQRLAVVWIGYFDTSTGAVVADPTRLMTARMAHVAATDGPDPGIRVKLVAKAAQDGLRANGWTLSDAHQLAFYAGDKALEFVPQLVGKELRFGTPDPVNRNVGSGIKSVLSYAQSQRLN